MGHTPEGKGGVNISKYDFTVLEGQGVRNDGIRGVPVAQEGMAGETVEEHEIG